MGKRKSAQEKDERRVGEQLIEWYNQRHGTSFRFDGRPAEAPDGYYLDGNVRLRVEVTSAYYDDGDDARYKWLPTGHPDAPNEWEGTDFEQHLVNDINSCIAAKCLNSYGPNCLLAVYVDADMTTAVEMEGAFRPNTALKAFTFALNLYRLSTHWLPGCLNMANNRRSEACGNSIPRLFEG